MKIADTIVYVSHIISPMLINLIIIFLVVGWLIGTYITVNLFIPKFRQIGSFSIYAVFLSISLKYLMYLIPFEIVS